MADIDKEKEPLQEETAQQPEERMTEDTAADTQEQEETAQDIEEDENLEEAQEDSSEDGRKGIFGRKKDKKDKKQELIDELSDKLKRSMAEFDNFRKRTDREKNQMYEIGAKEVIDKILPVVDNFERGFAGVTPEQMEDPFVSGMDMVYKQLMTALEGMGVKQIEALGSEFDPNLHNAVMQVASEEYESGIVAQELQKGYMYKETVVRHSMVAVAE